jgi:hypothetical protein
MISIDELNDDCRKKDNNNRDLILELARITKSECCDL